MNLQSALKNAIDSSGTVQLARHVSEESLLYVLLVGVIRWIRRTQTRIVAGFASDASAERAAQRVEGLAIVAAESRLVTLLDSWLSLPWIAWHDARLRQVLDPIIDLDLPTHIRMIAWSIVTAVVTHTILYWVLGVSVQALGWSARGGLVSFGLLAARRPDALAAAWRARASHPR